MAVERKLISESKRKVAVREFLHKQTERAGFGGAEVQRTPMGTRITLVAERPGFVIGRRGSTIKALTADVADRFDLDNPQIEVTETSNPNLNPQIMALKLAEALERGWHFRRAGHSTLRRIMESGAKGALIILAGKVTGGRKRREKFAGGHIKFCGDTALQFMEKGFATAKKKLGSIGVTVAIMDPNARLPDEIDVIGPPEGEQPEPAVREPGKKPETPKKGAAPEQSGDTAPKSKSTPAAGQASEAPEPKAAAGETTTPKAETPAASEAADTAKEAAQEVREEAPKFEGGITDIEGVGPKKADALKSAGFDSLADLDGADLDDIAEVEGIGPKLAAKIKDELKKMRK